MVETAYFGAGCFWGAELAFSEITGVIETEVGFSNITTSKGKESRVETVKLEFDPSIISYIQLIDSFWSTHDPSSKQHKSDNFIEKSVLFAVNKDQSEQAKSSLENHKKQTGGKPIFTIIQSFLSYNKAPEKDQQYYSKRK